MKCDTWYIPIVLRANFCKTVKGGWSAILRRFLTLALIGPSSFTTGGLLVRFSNAAEQMRQCRNSTKLSDAAMPTAGRKGMRQCRNYICQDNIYARIQGKTIRYYSVANGAAGAAVPTRHKATLPPRIFWRQCRDDYANAAMPRMHACCYSFCH